MVRKLTEDAVIRRVCKELRRRNYVDIKTKTTRQHGIDIKAKAPDGTALVVEAKGETSSKPGTKRYRIGFNRNQKEDSLGRALLWACQRTCEGTSQRVAIALPGDTENRQLVESIECALSKVGIVVILAHHSGSVEILGRLP